MNIIGEMQDPEKFMPMTIKRVLSGESMTIHGSPDGKIGSRFYLHARNQADALLFILKNIPIIKYNDYKDYEINRPVKFHVVGEREINNLEMAKLIAKFVGKPLKYEMVDFHSSRPGHDLRYALDGTKLKKAGWVPPLPLEKTLKQVVEWTIKHPEWLL